MAYHDELLAQAIQLVHVTPPTQATLRRAVSAAYYAVFHLLIAEATSNWNNAALRAALSRAFDHGAMKTASNRILNTRDFPFTGEDTVVREIAAWGEDPEQQLSREELGGILDSAIQSLEPLYRSVFVLRDIEELSTEETAEALGLSVPAVKSRLLRARLQLREKLTRFFKRKGDDAFAYM